MQDFAQHLGSIVVFVIACALDIGTRHAPFVRVIVAGIGAVVIGAFVLVLRIGIRVDSKIRPHQLLSLK